MKKKILVCVLALTMLASVAGADEIDLTGYTVDELIALHGQIDDLLDAYVDQATSDTIESLATDGLLIVDNGTEAVVRSYTGTATRVVIPAEYNGCPVTQIWDSAFKENTVITEVVLPETITTIGKNAFYNCKTLCSVNIPASVTTIDDHAFTFDDKLIFTNLRLNASYIGDYAFGYTKIIGSVTITADTVTLASQAFRNSTIPGIKIDASSISLGFYSLTNCGSLEYILFTPQATVSMEKESVTYCEKLTSIFLTENTTIADKIFSNCPNIVFYMPANSNAMAFAKANFVPVVTTGYDDLFNALNMQ